MYYFSLLLLFPSKSGSPRAKEGVGENPSFRILIIDIFWNFFELFHIDCFFACFSPLNDSPPYFESLKFAGFANLPCPVFISFSFFLHSRAFCFVEYIFEETSEKKSELGDLVQESLCG